MLNLAAAARAACRRDDTDSALGITAFSWPQLIAQRGELLDYEREALQLLDASEHERYAQSCAELAMSLFVLRSDLVGARHNAEEALADGGRGPRGGLGDLDARPLGGQPDVPPPSAGDAAAGR